MKTQLTRIITALALLAGLHRAPAPPIIGTAFTYQGRLADNTNPASGSYDLAFSLYAAASGGSSVAGPLTNSATGVTNGLFTVTLDFGTGVFTGVPYWLDISVRTNGNGSFAQLSPRQQLTPAPYAIFSESAGLAATANGVAVGSVTAAGIAGGQVVESLNGLEDAVTLAPGANVTITPSGNTLTIASTGGGGGNSWSLAGNSGTTGSNFLGTTDNQPLEIWVNGLRALRLEPGAFGPNVIGGAPNNSVASGSLASTIGGGNNNSITGGNNNSSTIAGGSGNTAASGGSAGSQTVSGGFQNTSSNLYSTVSGGEYNTANANGAVVGGGYNNTASGREATVSGGAQNTASGDGTVVAGGGYDGTTVAGNTAAFPAAAVGGGLGNNAVGLYATVAGGWHNNATSYAFVGGGAGNTANGFGATIPGGFGNTADGYYSFAAGNGAQTFYNGSFVWSDFSGGNFAATTDNQFSVRAWGGVRFETHGAGVTIDGVQVTTGGGGGGTPNTNGWLLTGNAGANPATGHFLGTTDTNALELRVFGVRGMRLDYADRGDQSGDETSMNVTGGSWRNTISAGVVGGTIAGGGDQHYDNINGLINYPNTVIDDFGTVGGGNDNTAGFGATIPGGYGNSAIGNGSFAAGRNAHTTYAGSFIWGDGTGTFNGIGANHFDVLASGGTYFQTSIFNVSAPGGMAFNIGNNNLTVGGKFMTVTGFGNEQAYFGSDDPSGTQIEIGSLRPGTTDAIFYNITDSKYMHLFCSSITIEGGADLAEPFQISSADKEVPQGAVLVIDSRNPGHLKVSDQPYDTRVAGVVSGANGINPGIQLQQQGVLEGGKNVALTGRVYVQADAANGPIEPGDLLTSSTTPGHAMRVSDHSRAQGAILGKAMTGLKDGQGMVLVLVTLQ